MKQFKTYTWVMVGYFNQSEKYQGATTTYEMVTISYVD